MPLTFWKSPRFSLRALLGANNVSDIDTGFQALAEDLDALLYAPGDLRLTAKNALDAGWLNCDGSAVNRVTYAALFAAIGTAYGEGDKATTFNVPDYRGRTPVGAGTGTGLTARARGAKLGEETHALSEGEMPSHSHAFTDENGNAIGGVGITHAAGGNAGNFGSIDPHNYNGGGIGIKAAGGSQAHNNMQPSTVCNVWVKT